MHADNRRTVDAWWRNVFDVDDELWSSVTVLHPHGLLDDYVGWYVAWRDGGVHVSAPSGAGADEVSSLREGSAPSLQAVEFWDAFARQRGLVVMGPSTHSYLDVDPGRVEGVVEVTGEDLELLRPHVPAEEWDEGGMLDEPVLAFGVVEDGVPVAVAALSLWRDVPSDVGVVVAPDRRGRGLASAVARHAASYAVREHGIARWRATLVNVASSRAAERLGFEPYATQLAVRPRSAASAA